MTPQFPAFQGPPALVVVDVQKYYLLPASDFQRFHESRHPGALDYIGRRCRATVLPNIARLLEFFRASRRPVFFLRLCGRTADRSDLHAFFREANTAGQRLGLPAVYPLATEPMAAVMDEVAPAPGEATIDKTTFSAFTGTDFETRLRAAGVETLVFCGLATSQCVDTTARDASERGFRVIHVPDAQADYSDEMHHAALFSSQGVCGGYFMETAEFSEGVT